MATTNLQKLELGGRRDGLLYVPRQSGRGQGRMPLLVALHGAGGNGAQMAGALQALAENAGLILLAPDSRSSTWDLMLGRIGPDTDFLNRAMARVQERFEIDPSQVGISGFSDGASYALTVGLENGDRFSHILAYSPGYMAPRHIRNSPRIFISHGRSDRVLPIEHCSRRIAPQLRQHDLEVRYREFDGGHVLPPEIVKEGVDWFLEPARASAVKLSDIRTLDKGIERT